MALSLSLSPNRHRGRRARAGGRGRGRSPFANSGCIANNMLEVDGRHGRTDAMDGHAATAPIIAKRDTRRSDAPFAYFTWAHTFPTVAGLLAKAPQVPI